MDLTGFGKASFQPCDTKDQLKTSYPYLYLSTVTESRIIRRHRLWASYRNVIQRKLGLGWTVHILNWEQNLGDHLFNHVVSAHGRIMTMHGFKRCYDSFRHAYLRNIYHAKKKRHVPPCQLISMSLLEHVHRECELHGIIHEFVALSLLYLPPVPRSIYLRSRSKKVTREGGSIQGGMCVQRRRMPQLR